MTVGEDVKVEYKADHSELAALIASGDFEGAYQKIGETNALPAVCRLAKKYKTEMPIVQSVDAILRGKLEARNALAALMERDLKHE